MNRRPREKRLKAIQPNAGVTAEYERRLIRLITDMASSYRYWLVSQYRETPPAAIAMDARPRKTKIQAQIDEYKEEGIFLRPEDDVDIDRMPLEDFNGITIRASQTTVDASGVRKWKKRIKAGERPAVLLEEVSPGKFRIVDGHHRATAYRDLGITNIPVIVKNRLHKEETPAEHMQSELMRLGREWQIEFDSAGPQIGEWFAKDVADRSTAGMQRILREANISVDFQLTPMMRDALDATSAENVGLIRSIPQQYHTQVHGMVMESVARGRDLQYLTNELENRYGITRRRAETIARDQNNKATSVMNAARQKEAKIEEGIWVHTGGGKEPRRTHLANNGKRFKIAEGWFDPDPKVRRNIQPGELINCRCVCRPVVKGFS